MTLDLKGWIGTCQLGCEGNFKLRNENRIREATGIWNICITEWVSLNHFICIFEFELSGNNLKLSIVCWNWLTSTFRRDIYKEYRHIGLGGKKELTLNAVTTEYSTCLELVHPSEFPLFEGRGPDLNIPASAVLVGGSL